MGRSRATGFLVGVAVWAGIGVAVPAASQPVRERILIENPYRNPGGSCIYGQQGQLVYAPVGTACPAKETEGGGGGLPTAAVLTPEMGKRMRELFATHPHIADEIVAVRQAVEAGDRARALERIDHVLGEVSANKAAAERVLGEMSNSQAPR